MENKSNIKNIITPEFKETLHKMIQVANYNWRNYWVPYLKEQENNNGRT